MSKTAYETRTVRGASIHSIEDVQNRRLLPALSAVYGSLFSSHLKLQASTMLEKQQQQATIFAQDTSHFSEAVIENDIEVQSGLVRNYKAAATYFAIVATVCLRPQDKENKEQGKEEEFLVVRDAPWISLSPAFRYDVVLKRRRNSRGNVWYLQSASLPPSITPHFALVDGERALNESLSKSGTGSLTSILEQLPKAKRWKTAAKLRRTLFKVFNGFDQQQSQQQQQSQSAKTSTVSAANVFFERSPFPTRLLYVYHDAFILAASLYSFETAIRLFAMGHAAVDEFLLMVNEEPYRLCFRALRSLTALNVLPDMGSANLQRWLALKKPDLRHVGTSQEVLVDAAALYQAVVRRDLAAGHMYSVLSEEQRQTLLPEVPMERCQAACQWMQAHGIVCLDVVGEEPLLYDAGVMRRQRALSKVLQTMYVRNTRWPLRSLSDDQALFEQRQAAYARMVKCLETCCNNCCQDLVTLKRKEAGSASGNNASQLLVDARLPLLINERGRRYLAGENPSSSPDNGKPLDAVQCEAVRRALLYPVTCITGPGGTGKSHTAAELVRCFGANNVMALAPTGKATSVLEQYGFGQDVAVHTIHNVVFRTMNWALCAKSRLHETRLEHWLTQGKCCAQCGAATSQTPAPGQEHEPDTLKGHGFQTLWTALRYPLANVRVLLIDEASMMDFSIFIKLLQQCNLTPSMALAGLERIVLMGDVEQLEPVGYGRVFRDFCQALEAVGATTTLRTNYRSAETQVLFDNARHVIERRAEQVRLQPGTFELVPYEQQLQSGGVMDTSALFRVLRPFLDQGAHSIERRDQLQFLTQTNAMVDAVNAMCRGKFHGCSQAFDGVHWVGERIFATRNTDDGVLKNGELLRVVHYCLAPVTVYGTSARLTRSDYESVVRRYVLPAAHSQARILCNRPERRYLGPALSLPVDDPTQGEIAEVAKQDDWELYCLMEVMHRAQSDYRMVLCSEHMNGGSGGNQSLFKSAYCSTTHRFQGSEAETIVYLVPRVSKYASRKDVYTALTRAKRRVVILGTMSAFRQTARQESPERRSQLTSFLHVERIQPLSITSL